MNHFPFSQLLRKPASSLSALAFAFVFVLIAARPSVSADADRSSAAQIKELNTGYIQAFLQSDVNWYREHLAEDFTCILTDGKIIDKAAFLRDTATDPGVDEYHFDDLQIRVYGDTALAQAVGSYKRHDGSTGKTRYIDIYVKQAGVWKAVSAQLTRLDTSHP
jgi:ketosteroid isomerase-like protein